MAVTELKYKNYTVFNNGQNVKPVSMYGKGSPIGDTELAKDGKYPVGSDYTDIDNGNNYVKYKAGTWTSSSEASGSVSIV